MEHRQPRLGDILDDYCPRERRITNHAVVAMVGPEIKQTRCTTCDAEHEYKHAKVPSTRKKKEEAPAALYKQVLASAQPEAVRAAEAPAAEDAAGAPAAPAPPAPPEQAAAQAAAPAQDEAAGQGQPDDAEAGDDGPVHRRLIRATLPRPEGVPTQRPMPQFTVRQPGKFNNNNARGGRPQGTGPSGRPRISPSRGSFGRNNSRGDNTFTARPSGGPHHSLQRPRPAHRPTGRPVRHGKKSPK